MVSRSWAANEYRPSTKRNIDMIINQLHLLKIEYFIFIKEFKYSFFNQYLMELIESNQIIDKISSLPKDILEFYLRKEAMISRRASGLSDPYKITISTNIGEINNSPYSFKVAFLIDDKEFDQLNSDVIKISKNVASCRDKRIINIDDLCQDRLLQSVKDRMRTLDSEKIEFLNELVNEKNHEISTDEFVIDEVYSHDIYTIANLNCLRALRIKFNYEKNYFDFCEEDIKISLELVLRIRNEILNNFTPDPWLPNIGFIISDISNSVDFLINKSLYEAKKHKAGGVGDDSLLADAIKLINSSVISSKLKKNKYLDDFYSERQHLESLISLLSASYVAANIKLPLPNNLIFDSLSKLRGTDKKKNNDRKVRKVMRKLLDEFESHSLNWFGYLNKTFSSNIKVVSNFPIEWAYHDGIPMMIRHEVSRIPVSPGHIATKMLLQNDQMLLTLDDFKKIRIISSFKETDPIKDDLKNRLEFLKENLALDNSGLQKLVNKNPLLNGMPVDSLKEGFINIEIDWINVGNFEELKVALNAYECAITIFDLHGGHDENSSGFLVLRDENVSIEELVGKVNMSPIVILSSCDTFPVDRNHETTTNAFLLAGARTVLASALPILSGQSSNFILRLLIRVQRYLPLRVKDEGGVSVRWSSFVTGMTRRVFYTEFILFLKARYRLNQELINQLNFDTMTFLDPLRADWHDHIIDNISASVGVDSAQLKALIGNEFIFPESLKYLQIGNPESILVVAKNHIPVVEMPASYPNTQSEISVPFK